MNSGGGKADNRNDSEEDAGPEMGVYDGSDGEARSGNKERVGN